jgi:fructose-1-phosphate kinase PfkB-like protein
MTAGIAAGLASGKSLVEAVTWGVACASASAETLLPGRFDRARAQEFWHNVSLEILQESKER